MFDKKLQIVHGEIPKVLLLGNGFNRTYGFASWDELIASIGTKELSGDELKYVKTMPYTLQPVVLTDDHLDMQMKSVSGTLSDLRAPEAEEALLRKFASLPVNGILTANYTYELEKAMDSGFRCVPGCKCKARQTALEQADKFSIEQLHTWFFLEDHPPVWHIHGEAARHRTMVLGHYYYGKLLAKMQQYISSMLARYTARNTRGQSYDMRSWIDAFMLGDVYIVGFGMALSEIDLWWLINCKKRKFPDRKIVLYKMDIQPQERMLAEVYGVTVETGGFEGDYLSYYNWVYDQLKQELKA